MRLKESYTTEIHRDGTEIRKETGKLYHRDSQGRHRDSRRFISLILLLRGLRVPPAEDKKATNYTNFH